MHNPAVVSGVGAENGITRRGHEDDIARIDEGGRKNRQGGLAADGVADFRFRVGLHPENFPHVLGRGGPQAGSAVVGVTTVLRLGGFQRKGGDHPGVGHGVRLAHTEIEQFLAWMGGQGGPLGPLDALELVDRRLLQAVAGAADSPGEEVVEVCHIFVSFGGREDYDKTRPNAKGQPGLEEKGPAGGFGSDDGGPA